MCEVDHYLKEVVTKLHRPLYFWLNCNEQIVFVLYELELGIDISGQHARGNDLLGGTGVTRTFKKPLNLK